TGNRLKVFRFLCRRRLSGLAEIIARVPLFPCRFRRRSLDGRIIMPEKRWIMKRRELQ
ncbi:hypothetical protein RYX36_024100, partial [Vicia faba]